MKRKSNEEKKYSDEKPNLNRRDTEKPDAGEVNLTVASENLHLFFSEEDVARIRNMRRNLAAAPRIGLPQDDYCFSFHSDEGPGQPDDYPIECRLTKEPLPNFVPGQTIVRVTAVAESTTKQKLLVLSPTDQIWVFEGNSSSESMGRPRYFVPSEASEILFEFQQYMKVSGGGHKWFVYKFSHWNMESDEVRTSLDLHGGGAVLQLRWGDIQPGEVAQDIRYVKQRIRNYFQRIVELSASAGPPGRNAANGWFREFMVSDSTIRNCGALPTLPLYDDAKDLFDIYLAMYGWMQRGFVENGNVPGTDIVEVIWANIGALASGIFDIVSGILELISDPDDKEAAQRKIAEGIRTLVTDVNNRGLQINGTHANGWISVYERDAANWTNQRLNARFPNGTGTDAGRVAEILRTTNNRIAGLRTDGHNPWLLAEWQIQYQAILQSAVAALDALRI